MQEQFTAILLVIQVVYAQAPRAHEPAVGQLLVATRKSHDPDLKQTVILLVHYDQDGAIGLILNRKSNKKDQPFYFGGPINLGTRVLLRARTKPADAERIGGDVYVLRNPTQPPASTVFRVYAGYTGWSTP